MKQIIIIVCLIFPLAGFSQTEEDAKLMLRKRGNKEYSWHGVDSTTQKVIVENIWKKIYYKKNKGSEITKVNPSIILSFKGEKFFYTSEGKAIFSGDYSFDWKFLSTEFVEMGDYEIIDLIDNEYLVVESYLPTGRNGAYKSTHCRELYQRQNMTQADRIPNEKKATQMFTEIPHLEDTIITSSITGIWKQIYMYKIFTKINDLQKITFENSVEFKDGKFYRNYPKGTYKNVTGQYFINGVYLSFFSENGEDCSFKIINLFDNEYMVIEKTCILKNNKVQKPILRLLLKRIE